MLKSKQPFFSVVFGGAIILAMGCAPSFLVRKPQSIPGSCPRVELGEVESDCPWADWVREFERQPALADALPEAIALSLERDHEDAAIHEAWGLSQNFDEGAKAEIVRAPILEAIAQRMGVEGKTKQGRTIIHAGTIHTYGYLLSNLKTPFGYKRSRWVSGRLERGLRLPRESLGPSAYLLGDQTTLLSQVTFLLMKAALKGRPEEWARWQERLEPRVTPALKGLKLEALARSVETQVLPSGEEIEWVTDFVALPGDPQGGRLLVYSQRSKSGTRLITGFPVEKDFTERKSAPVKPRYNAWVD